MRVRSEGAASVVDDVPELRELIRFGMEEDSAFEGISATHPAVVLLDLSMPDMNGLEAIPEIRSREPDIASIVLSGCPAARMVQTAEEQGADGYVEKGTPIAKLRSVTRQAVADRAAA